MTKNFIKVYARLKPEPSKTLIVSSYARVLTQSKLRHRTFARLFSREQSSRFSYETIVEKKTARNLSRQSMTARWINLDTPHVARFFFCFKNRFLVFLATRPVAGFTQASTRLWSDTFWFFTRNTMWSTVPNRRRMSYICMFLRIVSYGLPIINFCKAFCGNRINSFI